MLQYQSVLSGTGFQIPLHYPKINYEKMPEWKQYGLLVKGDANYKRKFDMGAFLWPDQ